MACGTMAQMNLFTRLCILVVLSITGLRAVAVESAPERLPAGTLLLSLFPAKLPAETAA